MNTYHQDAMKVSIDAETKRALDEIKAALVYNRSELPEWNWARPNYTEIVRRALYYAWGNDLPDELPKVRRGDTVARVTVSEDYDTQHYLNRLTERTDGATVAEIVRGAIQLLNRNLEQVEGACMYAGFDALT